MSAPLTFRRFGRDAGADAIARPVDLDLAADDVASFDDLMRAAFRLGRGTYGTGDEPTPARAAACDAANAGLRALGHELLGEELFDDVMCALGDGSCEEGSLYEALAELWQERVIVVGQALARQLRKLQLWI